MTSSTPRRRSARKARAARRPSAGLGRGLDALDRVCCRCSTCEAVAPGPATRRSVPLSTARPTWSWLRLITWDRAVARYCTYWSFEPRSSRRPAAPKRIEPLASITSVQIEVGFLFVDADEGLAGAGQHLPVQPPQVLAAGVLAEVDELARPAQLPRGVVAHEGPFHAAPRGEAHVLQRRQRAQVEEPAGRSRGHAATSLRSRSTMSAEVTESPTAR